MVRMLRDEGCEYRWLIPREGGMQVPGVVFGTADIVRDLAGTKALDQVRNVACMPGILSASLAMPDIHEGYGFPIGGVAAFSAKDGVITPGGIGYDINCGVRVLLSPLELDRARDRLPRLAEALFRKVPSGVGREGALTLSRDEMDEVMSSGAAWAERKGYGLPDYLEYCEENGAMAGADPAAVSDKAFRRGRSEVGTLGGGNHFIEAGCVSDVYDEEAAKCFGFFPGQVVFWVHSGSRGLGHQVCTEYIGTMRHAAQKYGLVLPDRQLDSAPISSPEGKRYFAAMAAAANYAWANRQVLTHLVREVVVEVFPEVKGHESLRLLYDVAHNIGKIEQHQVDGREMDVLVHRKGATRAFPAGHPHVPAKYRAVGQPVLIPGDMGRASYILRGTPQGMALSFGSACHGAGRARSRTQAKRTLAADDVLRDLRERGVFVKAASLKGLVEEAPAAYKDVDEVVAATSGAGLATTVAKLRPLAVIKG